MESVFWAEAWAMVFCTSVGASERAFFGWGMSVVMLRLDPAAVEVILIGSC